MAMQPIQLDGTKPLFGTLQEYLEFNREHKYEIMVRAFNGDENAGLIMAVFVVKGLDAIVSDPTTQATLMIAIERYISEFHSDIAVIVGDYPKEVL